MREFEQELLDQLRQFKSSVSKQMSKKADYSDLESINVSLDSKMDK